MATNVKNIKFADLVEGKHYTIDGYGIMTFTSEYHISRGTCCGNKCKHCPYIPKYVKGNTTLN